MLEREPVTMPKYQWDISDPLACTQVFFGTGDEFRTGQAAGPGTIKEQWKAESPLWARYGFLAQVDSGRAGNYGHCDMGLHEVRTTP